MNKSAKILLVINDPNRRDSLSQALTSSDSEAIIKVAVSLDGYRSALANPRAQRPDLVIMELTLTDGTACEALTTPWEEGPLPIIVLLEPAEEGEAQRLLEAGAADCIVTSQASLATLPTKARHLLMVWAALQDLRIARRTTQEMAFGWQRTFDAIPYPLFMRNMQGLITRCNQATLDFFGKDRDHIEGQPCWQVVHGTSAPICGCPIPAMLDSRKRQSMTLPIGDRTFQVTVDPVIDRDGEVISIVHGMEDITERLAQQETLLAREAELSAIYTNAPLVLMLVDSEHRVRKINHPPFPQNEEEVPPLVGLRGGEALGCLHAGGPVKGCGFAPECQHCPACQTVIDTLTTGQTHLQIDCSLPMRVAGQTQNCPFLLSTSPITLRNETLALVSLMDISRLKQAEEQVQHAVRMETIGTLAGGIAHDFNNILTPILGFATLALDDLPPEGAARFDIERITEAGSRAKALVKQLLNFSRQHEEERQPVQAAMLIKEALKLMRSAIPTTIELKKNITAGDQTILIDPSKLHQVVMNLCTNAYQAMRETGGAMTVALEEISLGQGEPFGQQEVPVGDYLRLTVSDNGPGMDQTTLAHIFEPYFTTKGKENGTGLGLAVVHGIILSSQGFISVRSAVGEGTTFQVIWPVFEHQSIPLPQAALGTLPHGNEAILLIDDDPAVLEICARELSSLGYQVTSQTDPLAALSLVQQTTQAFALVLTDYAMPKMHGLELSTRMLATRPELKIVMMTGFADIITPEQMAAANIRQVLLKPLLRRELATAIRATLDKA